MCGVLTVSQSHVNLTLSPSVPPSPEKGSFCHSQDSEREVLQFDFEYDFPIMSNHCTAAVANLGTGINGRLLSAVNNQNIRAAKTYLKCGADPNVTTRDKRSALHLAAASGRVDLIRLLLDAGADPSPIDQHQRTPLHISCLNQDPSAALTLLYGGADPNAGNQPRSALHCAILAGHSAVVKVLISYGADVNVMGFLDYNSIPVSPLGLAFQQANWEVFVPLLLKAGARMNNLLGSSMHATAFEVVLFTRRDPSLLKYLIQSGCVPKAKELEQHPFLSFRCRTFKRSLVALILRLTQDGCHSFDEVRSLYEMLEAAGYLLRDDPFCKHLMGVMSIKSASAERTNPTSRPRNTPPVLETKEGSESQLTASQLAQALQQFHWGGLDVLPTAEIVTYFRQLAASVSAPQEVRKLSDLCRCRVRSRLGQVNKETGLQTLVERLPLPHLHKQFLLLKDM